MQKIDFDTGHFLFPRPLPTNFLFWCIYFSGMTVYHFYAIVAVTIYIHLIDINLSYGAVAHEISVIFY